jgi:hypothetical protein
MVNSECWHNFLSVTFTFHYCLLTLLFVIKTNGKSANVKFKNRSLGEKRIRVPPIG